MFFRSVQPLSATLGWILVSLGFCLGRGSSWLSLKGKRFLSVARGSILCDYAISSSTLGVELNDYLWGVLRWTSLLVYGE